MPTTTKECSNNREKMVELIKSEKHYVFNKLQEYMEKGYSKLEEKIERHEDKQDQQFDILHEKLDKFASTKLDKQMYIWLTGGVAASLLLLAGALYTQALDINSIKTALQLAEITYE